jgi:hypothetical protein
MHSATGLISALISASDATKKEHTIYDRVLFLFVDLRVQTGKNLVLEEAVHGLGSYGEHFVVDADRYVIAAVAHTEGTAQTNLVFQMLSGNAAAQEFSNGAGTFQVAVAANANGNFHGSFLSIHQIYGRY